MPPPTAPAASFLGVGLGVSLALRFIPAASSPLPPREIAPRALPLERVLSGVVRTVELARIVHTIVISDAKQGTTASHSTLITGLSISD